MHWRSFETETAGLASCNNQPVDLMSVIPKRKNRRWLPHEVSICMRILSLSCCGRWAQMARGQMSGACRAGPTGSAWPESSIINLEHTEWPPRTAPSPKAARVRPARAGVARAATQAALARAALSGKGPARRAGPGGGPGCPESNWRWPHGPRAELTAGLELLRLDPSQFNSELEISLEWPRDSVAELQGPESRPEASESVNFELERV